MAAMTIACRTFVRCFWKTTYNSAAEIIPLVPARRHPE